MNITHNGVAMSGFFTFLNDKLMQDSLSRLYPFVKDSAVDVPVFDRRGEYIVENMQVDAIEAFEYLITRNDLYAEIALHRGANSGLPKAYQKDDKLLASMLDSMEYHLSRLTIRPASLGEIQEYTNEPDLAGCFIPSQSRILINQTILETDPVFALYTLQHEFAHAVQRCSVRPDTPEGKHELEFRHTLLTLIEKSDFVRRDIIESVKTSIQSQSDNKDFYAWEKPLTRAYEQNITYLTASELAASKNRRKNPTIEPQSFKAVLVNGAFNLFDSLDSLSSMEIIYELSLAKGNVVNQKSLNRPFMFYNGVDFIYGDGVNPPVQLGTFEALLLLCY